MMLYILRERTNMHIYSEEEYLNRLKLIRKRQIMTPIFPDRTNNKSSVIKNYVYYDKTVKICDKKNNI